MPVDQKISELTVDTTPTVDDLVVLVNDPTGTPASRKATVANLQKADGLTGVLKATAGVRAAASAGTDYVAPGAITSSGLTQATGKLLGRSTASSGAIEELTVGSGLALSGGTLSGPLIGLTAYAAGSDTTLHTQASATLTDMDATNASVTFTAPASGNVLIHASVLSSNSTVNGATVYFGLRESTTDLATVYVVNASVGEVGVASRRSVTFYLTGISAGSHTYKLAHSASSGSTSTFTGPLFGRVVIEVWAAP